MSTPTVGEKRQIIVTLNGADVVEYTGTSDNTAVASIVPGGAVNFVQLHSAGDFTLNLTASGGETGSATFTVVESSSGELVITLSEPV